MWSSIHLIMFYFVMSCCHLLEDCSFLMRDRKVVDLERRRGGEELGGVDEGETVIRIYCIKKGIYPQGERGEGEKADLIICTRRFLFCNYQLESRTSTQAIAF